MEWQYDMATILTISFNIIGILGYENGALHSAISTVVIIHIIIGWYIWLALKEEHAEQRPDKID